MSPCLVTVGAGNTIDFLMRFILMDSSTCKDNLRPWIKEGRWAKRWDGKVGQTRERIQTFFQQESPIEPEAF